jgi:hypothetical protein
MKSLVDYHLTRAADMMGWTGNALQQAMNSCTSFGGACSVLQTRTAQTQNDCALPPRVPEQVNGC